MATPAVVDKGFFRLVIADNRRTKKVVVAEYHNSVFNPVGDGVALTGAPTFESDMQSLPIMPKGIGGVLGPDDWLLIEARDDGTADDGVDPTEVMHRVRVPITIRNMRTGIVTEQVLAFQDFAWTALYAGDPYPATHYVEIGAVQVPAQEQWKVGHSIAHNSRVLIGLVNTDGAT